MLTSIIRTSLFLFLVIAGFLKTFSQAPGDTIAIVKEAKNILITKSEEKTKIYAEYLGEDGKESFFYYAINHIELDDDCVDYSVGCSFSLPYHQINPITDCERRALLKNKRKVRRLLVGADHIYAGWRFNYNDKKGIRNSFEFGIRNLIGISWQRGFNGPSFTIGAGLGMKRFDSQKDFMYFKRGDALILEDERRDQEKSGSYMDIFTLHLPFTFKQPIGKYTSFSLGASLNFNFYASAVSKSKMGLATETEKFKGLQQNLISPDIFVSFNIFGVGIYGSWNPVALFQSAYGPGIKGWAIGIDIISL